MAPLTQLLLIWTSVLLSIWLAERTRMTPVLWYLFMGAALVNLGWLPVEPGDFISGFAELGIIVIMFALGFEENIERFLSMARRSWGIALFGAAGPFLAAWGIALWMWGDHNIALMCGLAMTATAVSLTMVSLRSENLHKSPAASAIMASAVIDDIASLALVAILVPIAVGAGPVNVNTIIWTVLKAAVFFGVITAFSAWFFPHDIGKGWASKIPLVRRYGIRHLILIGEGLQASLVMLLVAISMALIGQVFGFHPAVGAYMAGLVLKEEYFMIQDKPSRSLYKRTKHVIDDVAFTWIGPVFFVALGSRLVFDESVFSIILGPALLLFAAVFIAQVISASLAARYTGRFPWNESLMIGFGMIGRAELAFVVMGIAYVQYPILTTEAFYTLMLAAFLLNWSVPLTIRWWKPFCTGARAVPGWMREKDKLC
jgi:Kef-type K+ transport system membrane component KefB